MASDLNTITFPSSESLRILHNFKTACILEYFSILVFLSLNFELVNVYLEGITYK